MIIRPKLSILGANRKDTNALRLLAWEAGFKPHNYLILNMSGSDVVIYQPKFLPLNFEHSYFLDKDLKKIYDFCSDRVNVIFKGKRDSPRQNFKGIPVLYSLDDIREELSF